MAYVSISRAAAEVKVFTDSATELGGKLSRQNSKMLALGFAAGGEEQAICGIDRLCFPAGLKSAPRRSAPSAGLLPMKLHKTRQSTSAASAPSAMQTVLASIHPLIQGQEQFGTSGRSR
jgi:hypothetical protein